MPVGTEKLDSMMRKVESLLERADHPNTPPAEAESARTMAERIMRKYKIEEEDLRAKGELVGDQFAVKFHHVKVYNIESPFKDVYTTLVTAAAQHAGVQCVWEGWGYTDGERVINLIGYEADVRYAESLFYQARLVFAARMEPRVDPSLTDEENVYALRSSGLERRKVAEMMGWVKGGAKVTRMYKAACAKRGEEPTLTGTGNNLEDYRVMYGRQFVTTFWQNLWRARCAVDAEITGGGLVLHGREERIKEAMYERWPHLRPVPAERGIGESSASKAQRYKGPSAAELRKEARRRTGAGAAGARAGQRAADEITIDGLTPRKRLSE